MNLYFIFRFIQGGRELYEFDRANSSLPHIRTVQRHLKNNASKLREGQLMVSELRSYLDANNYPLKICWSEDATRITGGVEYRSDTDELSGLVATLDKTSGLPEQGLFRCSNPQKVIEHIHNYPIARNVQLAMAQPLISGSAPFCLLYYCTENRFDTQSVTTKWSHVKRQLEAGGIEVVSKATDGDTRFVRAMIEEMGLTKTNEQEFGSWFTSNVNSICIQDPTHLANKLRTRMMNPRKQLVLGKSLPKLVGAPPTWLQSSN